MKVKAKKSISVIVVAVLAVAIGLGALSVSHNAKSKKEFVADGFILDAPAEAAVTEVNKQHYFSQGTKYQEKFDTKVLFKDASGQDVSIDVNQFLHYVDGSLGSFTKGVIMNLDDVGEEQFGYYSLTPNTLLVKNGVNYEMSSRGEKMTISEFVWKISDTDYMIVSPEVTLKLGTSQEITLPNYAQLKYVDSGIVRIIHQQGTYQTVSADSFLFTEGGAELNLVGKNFYQNGEPGLSLDSMAIDDEDYIELDENVDSPELKIPTFNVINGKDGAAGNAGESGEEGEQGEEGEDGEEGVEGAEGIEGAEGAAGEEGLAGTEGNLGKDGVEGDAGVMGYDGAEGEDGKDAINASEDGIVATDLLARPTVSVDTVDNYEVTAGSAKMEINMKDPDQSWIPGETTIDIIDRSTMESIFYDRSQYATEGEARAAAQEAAKQLGQEFENANGNIVLDTSALNRPLKADTEYIIVVNGQYVVEKDGQEEMTGTLFSKVFKTEALGIGITKDVVTDSSIAVKTSKNTTSVKSYSVHFYVYDDDGEKQTIGLYNNITGSAPFVYDETKPMGDDTAGEQYRYTDYELASNTTYYAEIANVVLSDDSMVDAGDTEIELTTLKKTPYNKSKDANGNEVITKVTAMQPIARVSAKTHSITVALDKLEDDDNGITGYRYELYRQSDIEAAAMDGTLANLVPAYTKSVEAAADQTFSIPEGDNTDFVARVVVEFNDNEKDVEYTTLFSDPVRTTAASEGLHVDFVIDHVNLEEGVTRRPDMIEGYIRIKDPGKVVDRYISSSYPLKLTITGEYDDIYTIKLDDTNRRVVDDAAGIYLYPFSKTGLHKASAYTLSVSGPWDTDGVNGIEGAEAETYLAGYRVDTINTYNLSMAFRSVNNMSAAFSKAFYLTEGSDSNYDTEDYKYEAKIMEYIEFELIHVMENGVKQKMGENATFRDDDVRTHDSIFFSSCWVDKQYTAQNSEQVDGEHLAGLEVSNTAGALSDRLVLTPASFGLDNNDSRFFAGGTFKIRAVVSEDYTAHKNEILFTDGEDLIEFSIIKRHVQAIDPNRQVSVEAITNAGARDAFKEDGMADETVVGLRFKAEYPYSDVKQIRYFIYELPDNDTTDYSGTTFKAADAPGTLVLTGTHNVGVSGGDTAPEVELYFTDTRSSCSVAQDLTWDKNTTVLSRGKRYYIRYEVTADCTNIDCGGDRQDDIYPNCAYEEARLVPFYRSPIIEVEKQVPTVHRYPETSGTQFATWMYHVIDPDNAIVGGFGLRQAGSAANVAAATKESASADVSAHKSGYAPLALNNLVNNNYYSVEVSYKLSSVASEETIASAPVQFKAKIDAANDISAKGMLATTTTPEGDKITVNGTTYEKAFVNEGGYRYRLTLQGKDIKKYAAFKVVLTGNDAGGNSHSVVFDPVYPSTIQSMGGDVDAAILYMDASPVNDLVTADVSTVTVSVDGYFTTYESGMKDYAATNVNGNTVNGLTLYALKTYQQDGTSAYRRLTNNNWISAQEVAASLMIPGNSGNGFVITDDSAVVNMTYPTLPLSVANDAMIAVNEQVTMDENGMRATGIASTSYYTIEKLAKKSGITFANNDASVTIGQILPAVQKVKINPGATSAYMQFKTLGKGAREGSQIYARVYKGAELLKVVQRSETIDGQIVKFYEVVGTGATTDYEYSNFNTQGIELVTSGADIIADLRIRGLEKDTDYRVIFFAYDQHNNVVDLYSIDGKYTGAPYEFKTLKEVDITVTGPTYTYNTYENKFAEFRFGLPGDEGTGKTICFSVYQGADTSGRLVIPETIVRPLGDGNYEYYSQSPATNRPITASMAPGSGLALGTKYTLLVVAKENTGSHSELGSTTVTFTTPSKFADPTFNITATSTKTQTEGKVRITATIASSDTQRAIMANQYTVTLKDSNGTVIGMPQTVTRSGNAHTEVVEFENIDGGKEYVVEVTANVDNSNNGVGDTEIIKKYNVIALGNTTADLSTAATMSQIQVLFTNLQGFDGVSKIRITVYSPIDQEVVLNKTIEITDDMPIGDGISQYFTWDKALSQGGNYPISVQYEGTGGEVLGNNSGVVIVQSDASAQSEGGATFSLRRMTSPAPKANATENDATENDATTTGTDLKEGTGTENNTTPTPDAGTGSNTTPTPDTGAGGNTTPTPDAGNGNNTTPTPDAGTGDNTTPTTETNTTNTETTTIPSTGATDNGGSGTEGQGGNDTTNTGNDAGDNGDADAGTTE